MKQLFLMVKDGSIKLIETPPPLVKDNYVVAETMYSIVSAGTERGLTSFSGKNLLQKAIERPDQVKKVLDKVSTDGLLTAMDAAFNKLNEPMPMGYSAVGRIVECGRGATGVHKGDIVAMAGQAYHAEINRVNRNLLAVVPVEPMQQDYRQYAMCALGGIALEGIHQADVKPGETVAVIGLGLVGHILARILNAYGCDVIAYDITDKTLPGTHLKAFIDSNDANAEEITRSYTKGRGADKVIITAAANSNAPMDLAAAIARDRAIICMIGVTQMNLDRRPYYKKELTFTIARSYGPGRYDVSYEEKGIDYPLGHVRFTEGRNLEEFVRLVSNGRLVLSDLITHEIDFENAADAYEMITTNKNGEKYIGVILKYGDNKDKWKDVSVCEKKTASKAVISIGMIGGGSFARSTILPQMKANGHYHFKALATTGGISTGQTSEMFGFDYVTNDYKKLLADDDIDLIVVSTQHNTHAKFIVEALNAGKNVYCEKPLCLSLNELDAIEQAYNASAGELFCGLNRRYSPLVGEIKAKLKTDKIPAVYNYIVNAGFIPEEHWTQDEMTGGGRIIGEAVHFVDTIQYLDGSQLKSLNVTFAENNAYPKNDNAVITLSFASGAVGTITYTSMGSKKYPKEQLMVFSSGIVYELDNYVRLVRYDGSKSTEHKLRQDKGIADEYAAIQEILSGKNSTSQIKEAFTAHRFLLEALQNG